MAGIWLSMVDYINYVGGNNNSRVVQEGEEVLNAGHLILCGKTEETKTHISIIALCCQSSALYSEPHKITGTLNIKRNKVGIVDMKCTCKAGLGGACKHVSAVLIQCTRVNLSQLETVSPTDLKCKWLASKGEVQKKYQATPLSQMSCFKNKMPNPEKFGESLSKISDDEILGEIAALLPECAINRFRVGRSRIHDQCREEESNLENFTLILNNSCQSVVMMIVNGENVTVPNECCEKLYSSLLNEDPEETIRIPQNCSTWHEFRRFRVTGSRCYELYTYNGSNWRIKAEKYFWPKSFTNKFIKHGLEHEDDARNAFIGATGFNVVQCGMVVSHSNKWMGYSPDGIVFENGHPAALLEIKCPWNGAKQTITEVIRTCDYISEHSLKRKHKFYGQIQMGMAMLNLKKCFLVLYASFDGSVLVLEEEYDEEFAENMLRRIKKNYFENMIHIICDQDEK